MSTTTSTPKKPPSNGTSSTPSTARKAPASSTSSSNATNNAPALNRSPSRMAASNSTSASATGTGTAATSGINRTRSVRNGTATPLSARSAAAAARKSTPSSDDNDDAKAELQAQIAELQEKLTESNAALTSSQKATEVLQHKLDDTLSEHTMLEDRYQESSERVEELENERRELLRGKREMEAIFESERAAVMKEREEAGDREGEMQRAMVRMKEALAAQKGGAGQFEEEGLSASVENRRTSRPLSISRTSSFRSSAAASPAPGGESARGFAPAGGLQRSDSRSSSRMILEKDRVIEGLRLDLAEAQIKLVELENKGGSSLQELERQMYDVKVQNARLMEENESFQLLLRDKTLSGDLQLRAPSSVGDGEGSRPSSANPTLRQSGTSLADELASTSPDGDIDGDMPPNSAATITDSKERRLQGEVNSLKDANKALTLYINNIISRLLQHEAFEQILDKTPDLMAGPGALSTRTLPESGERELPPPPPPPKDDKPGPGEDPANQSLLQRAGSVLRGRATRPNRPMSTALPPSSHSPSRQPTPDDSQNQTIHSNPSTAPRIPLGRSGSTRTGAAHRRTASDFPAAANVVTNMYKGPSPGLGQGPTSPGLGSPSRGVGGSFFPLNGGRSVSGNTVPTIDEGEAGKENAAPNPDATAPRSQRNSVISNPPGETNAATFADQAALSALTGEVPSNPSSPPRSTTSSGDRDPRPGTTTGGAIMMGSKPRPLRLVQESEEKKAGANANRGSWFGWMNKGAAAAGGFMPGRNVSGGEQGGPPSGPQQ